MKDVWFIAGHRVEKRWSLFGSKLITFDASGAQRSELALEGGSSWPLELAGRTFTVRRTQPKNAWGTREDRLELYAEDGTMLSRGEGLLTPRPAPSDARCAVHDDERALVSCARCGAFACAACAVDGARCASCVTKEGVAEGHARDALRWGAGGLLFLYLFGLLGALVGGLAAWAAVLYAKQTPRERFSVLVPLGLYVVAAVVCVAVRRLLLEG